MRSCSPEVQTSLGPQVSASAQLEGHPYSEWITTYGSPEYEELPQKQEELLNAVGPAQPYGEFHQFIGICFEGGFQAVPAAKRSVA